MAGKKVKPKSEARKLKELIHRFETVESMHGSAWCASMAHHYRKLYLELTGKALPKTIRL